MNGNRIARLDHILSLGNSHEAAVFIVAVLAVPELVELFDYWNLSKVVLGCGRGNHPLQTAGIPRVCTRVDGVLAVFAITKHHVAHEGE
ncbi:unannotated protein [freshwater metagenome]|uniref:Unannotated protein n=1 Tax=freshwater metagenome TaxID=449393 RepID=A0A6J7ML92_9ZZZZ